MTRPVLPVDVTSASPGRVGMAGFAVVGVAFGMARFCFGLTLPGIRQDLGLSELVLGLIASASFVGYLAGLLLSGVLAARRGPRAPTTVGGACAVLGCLVVAAAPTAPLLTFGAVLAGSAAGWVWAPYLEIVERVAPEPVRPRLLALIATGVGAGLVLVGLLVLAVGVSGWRLTWVGVGVAAAVAVVVNLRWVPPLHPAPAAATGTLGRGLLTVAVIRPLVFVTVAFAACTVYLVFAADAVQSGGLDDSAGGLLYVVLGVSGLVAVFAQRAIAAFGAERMAAVCLGAFGASLGILGGATHLLWAVLASAVLFGAAFATGSAVVSIWVGQVFPAEPARAFTALFVAGAVSSIATPTVVGALLTLTRLGTVLLAAAALTVVTAAAIAVPGRRQLPPAA